MVGCGPTVPADVYRTTVAEQREDYENRLFKAERARLACAAEADRGAAASASTIASLETRVQRLERAAARGRWRPSDRGPKGRLESGRQGRRRQALREALEKALRGYGQVVARRGEVLWRVSAADWFDPGSARLRPEAEAPLGQMASLMAVRGETSVSVELPRPRSLAAGEVESAWREAAERGVALLTSLQAQGVAPARMTLAVAGAGPDQRIVFVFRSNADSPRGQRSLDSSTAGRHRPR